MRWFGYFIIILLIISCSDDSPVQPSEEQDYLKISFPREGMNFIFGDTVIVETNFSGLDLNSFVISYFTVNNVIVDSSKDINPRYELNGIDYRPGDSRLAISALLNNGNEYHDTVNITITSDKTPKYLPVIYKRYPHDDGNFTQGLQYYKGYLYEGTGLYGSSSIIKSDLETGEIIWEKQLSDRYFGEGITIVNDKLYQLTYRSRIGFIYSAETFKSIGTFSYSSEGWGLTSDGKKFIMSDGTNLLHYYGSANFEFSGSIEINDKGKPVDQLNELELINGDVFANIWYSNQISRISIPDGNVIGWIDLSSIKAGESGGVLNGIAYRSDVNRLLITGKNWNHIYEIDLKPVKSN